MGLTQKPHSHPSNIPLPKELPSVEETLKKLAAALETASTPGLDRVEVQRLQVVATLSKTYQELLADYMNYREIEAKLNDMEAKYDALLKEKGKDDASKSVSGQVAEARADQPANPAS
jgi:type III secretory pathway component EscV